MKANRDDNRRRIVETREIVGWIWRHSKIDHIKAAQHGAELRFRIRILGFILLVVMVNYSNVSTDWFSLEDVSMVFCTRRLEAEKKKLRLFCFR